MSKMHELMAHTLFFVSIFFLKKKLRFNYRTSKLTESERSANITKSFQIFNVFISLCWCADQTFCRHVYRILSVYFYRRIRYLPT